MNPATHKTRPVGYLSAAMTVLVEESSVSVLNARVVEYCIDVERGPMLSSPYRSCLVFQTSSLSPIAYEYCVSDLCLVHVPTC